MPDSSALMMVPRPPEPPRPSPTLLRNQLGVFEGFLNDDAVQEICVNRPDEIFTYGHDGWVRHPAVLSFDKLVAMAGAVATETNQKVDERHPLLSATLPTGDRVQFVLPPACTPNTVSMTVRKPSRTRWSLDDLAGKGAFDAVRIVERGTDLSPADMELSALIEATRVGGSGAMAAFFRCAVAQRRNIVLSGAVGSGKTTLMRALMDAVPDDERIITIEDAAELEPRQPNTVQLFYSRGDQGVARIQAGHLLESCLRMFPSRIMLAELRGAEAWAYLRNVNSGHPGSMTSIHATSAALAFDQLTLLAKESPGGAGLSRDEIRQMLHRLVDVVVQMQDKRIVEIWFDPKAKHAAA